MKCKKEKNSKSLYIDLGLLAKLFNVKKKSLCFGIAETKIDDGECEHTPIVIINDNTDEYIDLTTGLRKKTAYATGLKEIVYKAVVLYKGDAKCFQFIMKDATCVISVVTLVANFGGEVLNLKK